MLVLACAATAVAPHRNRFRHSRITVEPHILGNPNDDGLGIRVRVSCQTGSATVLSCHSPVPSSANCRP